jgi:predicted RNA-binding Zn-ribbon protein involved in translation (DUF1610 family)
MANYYRPATAEQQETSMRDTIRICGECGVDFQPTRYAQKFCTPACRDTAAKRVDRLRKRQERMTAREQQKEPVMLPAVVGARKEAVG